MKEIKKKKKNSTIFSKAQIDEKEWDAMYLVNLERNPTLWLLPFGKTIDPDLGCQWPTR